MYDLKEALKNSFANGFVKGVLDLEQKLIALDADMYYELADYLKENVEKKSLICGDLIYGLKISKP